MTQARMVGTVPPWTLGWRLQRALAHSGLSAQQMADEMGVVRGTVSRWMHDIGAPPKSAYVKQWALRTGVPYEWLRYGEQPPTPDLGTAMAPYEGGYAYPVTESAQVIAFPLRHAAVAQQDAAPWVNLHLPA